MKKWEYIRRTQKDFEQEDGASKDRYLSSFGAQGWELIAATPETQESYEAWYFRRELPQPLTMAHMDPIASC